MPYRPLDDGTGETLRILDIDGYFAPTFDALPNHEKEVRSIPEWTCRSDDVYICAYPKAGTHWLWEVTSMLLNKSSDRIKLIKETAMLEAVSQEQYNNIPSPRVLNSHLPFSMLQKDIMKHKPKIVFVQRNPKDICVSFYNHHAKILEYEFNGTWENYVIRFLNGYVDYGSWFDYTLSWEQVIKNNPDLPVYIISYENMKKNVIEEIEKLSNFLNIKVDRDLIEDIAKKCDFSYMKKEKDPMEDASEWKDGQPGMYRKGQIGDWKNWFTVAQNEQFDACFNEKMKHSAFSYTFS